jgi:hypothetical protein
MATERGGGVPRGSAKVGQRGRLVAAVLACLTVACREPQAPLGPLSADTTEPFVVTLLDGGGQTASAGDLLPRAIRVRVTTEEGRPVQRVALATAVSGCGILFTCTSAPDTASFALIEGDSARTGADGTATLRLRAPRRIVPTGPTGEAAMDLRVYAFGGVPSGGTSIKASVSVPTVLRAGAVASFTWPLPATFALDSGAPALSYLLAVDAYGNAIEPERLPALSVTVADTTVATLRTYRGLPSVVPDTGTWRAYAFEAVPSRADWVVITPRRAGRTTVSIAAGTWRTAGEIVVQAAPRGTAMGRDTVRTFRAVGDGVVAIVSRSATGTLVAQVADGDSLRDAMPPVPTVPGRSPVMTARGTTVAWSYADQVHVSRDGGRLWSSWTMPDTGTRLASGITADGTIVVTKGNRAYRSTDGTWQEDVAPTGYGYVGLDARGRTIWGAPTPVSTNLATLRRVTAAGITSLVTPLSSGRIDGIVSIGDTTWFDVTETQVGSCGGSICAIAMRRLHLRSVGDDSVLVESPAPPALLFGSGTPRFEMARDGTPIAVRGGWYARRRGSWVMVPLTSELLRRNVLDSRVEWSSTGRVWIAGRVGVVRLDGLGVP